ncbi:MAG: DUF2254 domain-containing protein [Bacteroidales bacterium]
MKKIFFLWNRLTATFWFIPVVIMLASIILSLGLLYLDTRITFKLEGPGRFFLVNSSDSARNILSTISAAMIGVAGTVFSVTLVALSLASSQFGPRLVKNFMHVRLNQVVLGAYISTYLYCLLVLNAVEDGERYTLIPSVSILVAILATVANIVLLIFFIHQIATSIQADRIISDISVLISHQVKTLFPEKMGEEPEHAISHNIEGIKSSYPHKIALQCNKGGYLQYIDGRSLVDSLADYDALLELRYRPGGYLIEGLEIGTLYANEQIEQKKINTILDSFVTGKSKSHQQDLEFSVNQMVEIAARALSPGINDPYTAIACIDNLTTTMCYLAEAKFPSKYRFDDENNLRVIADTLDFDGVLDAAFNQIRQFSEGMTAVIIRLMEALTTIKEFTKTESQKQAVLKHAKMVMALGRQSIGEENDLAALKERAKKIPGILKPQN